MLLVNSAATTPEADDASWVKVLHSRSRCTSLWIHWLIFLQSGMPQFWHGWEFSGVSWKLKKQMSTGALCSNQTWKNLVKWTRVCKNMNVVWPPLGMAASWSYPCHLGPYFLWEKKRLVPPFFVFVSFPLQFLSDFYFLDPISNPILVLTILFY